MAEDAVVMDPGKTDKDVQKPMTDEERLALAKKLDDDLDDFINSLEKKRYSDGWSEDKWEVRYLPNKSTFRLLHDV